MSLIPHPSRGHADVHPDRNSVAIFSPNHIYYPIICFGVHRIGAAVTYAFLFNLNACFALIHLVMPQRRAHVEF